MDIVLKLRIDDKEVDAKIENADNLIKELRKEAKTTSDELGNWGNIITGFNQGLQLGRQVMMEFSDAMIKGTELAVLRREFKGTIDDIELFRQATSRTVSEANLIKLSNQASELGIELEQQAILFSLADDAADKFGTTIEGGFQKVIQASEGSERGVKSLGIQTVEYKQIVDDLAKAHGTTIDKLDAELQKRIRIDALLKASGITMNDVLTKQQDSNDKLMELNALLEDARAKWGNWLAEGVIPAIDYLDKFTGAGKESTFAIASIGTTIIEALPIIMQLIMYKKMLGLAADTSAASVSRLGVAIKAVMASAAPIIALGAALGVGLGMSIDYATTGAAERMNEASKKAVAQQMDENKKNLEEIKKENQRVIIKDGKPVTIELKEVISEQRRTVQEVMNDIAKLQNELPSVVAGSKEHVQVLKDIAALQKELNPTTSKAEEITNEQRLNIAMDYYEQLRIYDGKYTKEYEIFLNDELKSYNEMISKKGEGIKGLTREQITAYNLLLTRLDTLKPTLPDIEIDLNEDTATALQYLGADVLERMRIDNMQNEFERQSKLTDYEYQQQLERYQDYENFEEIKYQLDVQYTNRKKALSETEAEHKMNVMMQSLGIISGAYGQHTALAQVSSAAIATYNTYEAATKALTAGPIIGPILAALIVAAGLQSVAKIFATPPPTAGYNEGGILRPGQRGFFEGEKIELIAPEENFNAVMNRRIIPSIMRETAVQLSVARGYPSPAGSDSLMEKLFNKQFDKMEDWANAFSFRIEADTLRSAVRNVSREKSDLEL